MPEQQLYIDLLTDCKEASSEAASEHAERNLMSQMLGGGDSHEFLQMSPMIDGAILDDIQNDTMLVEVGARASRFTPQELARKNAQVVLIDIDQPRRSDALYRVSMDLNTVPAVNTANKDELLGSLRELPDSFHHKRLQQNFAILLNLLSQGKVSVVVMSRILSYLDEPMRERLLVIGASVLEDGGKLHVISGSGYDLSGNKRKWSEEDLGFAQALALAERNDVCMSRNELVVPVFPLQEFVRMQEQAEQESDEQTVEQRITNVIIAKLMEGKVRLTSIPASAEHISLCKENYCAQRRGRNQQQYIFVTGFAEHVLVLEKQSAKID